MDMPSPRTLKHMQSLSGKLESLNRFLSKSAKRSLPFLDMLKKCTNKKDFRWTEATEAAFLEIKKLVNAHYVSRSLQGAETNYTLMEKLTLALVYVAKRLRRYFQALLIKVISDRPIKQVLGNYEASEKLAKWVVELGAYDIQYVPRVALKGQVLADFLADTSMEINVAPVVASTPRVEDIPESLNERENLNPGPRA
ncbi:reverse transcriptase domain-containing protein [Tanacetum coccineum]